MDRLLKAKANPDLAGVDGETALMLAVQFSHPALIRLLLKAKAGGHQW